MNTLLFQLDGKIPNLALMRIAAHHRALGDGVELRVVGNEAGLEKQLWDRVDKVYGSAIFTKTGGLARRLTEIWPGAVVGGTGVGLGVTLEQYGIETLATDYSVYPRFRQSIGFTQRGCRMTKQTCPFCCVPDKEGKVRAEATVWDIWRGEPWPRELLLLDNDFFGQPEWRKRIEEIRSGGFKVSFNQGINARCLTEEAAEAIGSVDYRDDSMKVKRIYTAWDNRKDEERLFAGLERLVKYGVKPDHIMVYMIVGYWPDETVNDWIERRGKLREFGCRPYPMPFTRTAETVGFQRWVIGAYDKPSRNWPSGVPWEKWVKAKYHPNNL